MKRFVKIVAIVVLFAAAIGYVVFRVVLFDPFGGARASLDPLVPNDVDLMARRRDLAQDFEPFPMPRFWKTLRLKEEWEAFARTRFFRDHVPAEAIARAFAELEKAPDQIAAELQLDLMGDLLAREVMFVGRWRADGTLAKASIVRGTFKSKLLAEGIKLGFARRLAAGDRIQDYAEQDGVKSFTVDGQRLHLARSEDTLIAGDDFDLVKEIVALAGGSEELSLDESPQYRAAVLTPPPPRTRALDFVVDVADAAKQLGWKWPEGSADDDAMLKFARELLAPERFRQAMGRFALGSQIDLLVSASADRAELRPYAGGLLDGASTDVGTLHDFVGRVFPARVAIAGHIRLDLREFLRRIEGLLPPADRQFLNDFVSKLKLGGIQLRSTVELLDLFSSSVTNELAFAMEPDEAYHVPGTPDGEMQFPDPRWGPRIALVFPASDPEAASTFVSRVVEAIKQRPAAIGQVWKWSYPAGFQAEFWEIKTIDPDRPTFSIGALELQKRPCIVITTTGAFLNEIVDQKSRVESGQKSGLQADPQFERAREAVAGLGHGFLFVSSGNLRRVLHDQCSARAEDATRPDWVRIRKEIERDLARKRPELQGKPLDEAARKAIEPDVDAEITKREQEWKEVTVPKRTAELEADLEGLAIVRWLAVALRVNERDLEIRLRLATPANFPAEELGGG